MKVKEDTLDLFYGTESQHVAPFKTQLLKWIGNKQRFAHNIASFFPVGHLDVPGTLSWEWGRSRCAPAATCGRF